MLVFLSATLLSCSAQPPVACTEVLDAMRLSANSPDGRVYFIGSDTADKVLTSQLMSSLLGESALGYFYLDAEGKSAVDDCAVFLSPTGTCELFVFRCADSRDCPSLARLCLSRLSLLSGRDGFVEGGGRVSVIDNYVILAVCESPDAALDTAKRVIK